MIFKVEKSDKKIENSAKLPPPSKEQSKIEIKSKLISK